MIEGALILLFGIIIGRVMPSRIGSTKQKALEAKCGCDHHLSKHDPKTGTCAGTVTNPNFSFDHYTHARNNPKVIPCPCKQYVGPTPAEQFFSTPLILGS